MIEIREYRETDAEAMLALIRQLQAHEVALYDRMKPAADMGSWYIDLLKKQCAEDDGVILIAAEDGNALGYATILTNVIEDGAGDEVAYAYAYVGDLVVAEAARRRGIGRRLLDECERRARAAGRDELRITVLALNNGAREAYRGFGFSDLLVDMRKVFT
ncbi:GNAT family N-acetyltransferase [Taklimakanibacter lacteus]|uniref:GNAT family N-acetyltransferase n=1 Tax=Taklimakanibacter lacteus TaxID=2268456 RepID=UPI000E66E3C3